MKVGSIMIGYVKGIVTMILEDSVILENQGIGYRIRTSARELESLSREQEVVMYTYMYVREDEISLYGFTSQESLKAFRQLIAISGIGPKAAMSILSTLSVEELRMAILSQDAKAIAKANGIGVKGAQRIIMELKDKLTLSDISLPTVSSYSACQKNDKDVKMEVAMALTSLGYRNMEALQAIQKVGNADSMEVEELLKAALKKII